MSLELPPLHQRIAPMGRRRNVLILMSGVVVTILLALGFVVREALIDEGLIHWSGERVDRSIEIGQEIVFALKSYKDEQGQYPASLEGLVGPHIEAIRNPVAGTKRWHYTVRDDGSFALMFGSGRHLYPAVYYESNSHNWIRDQS